MYKKLLMSLLVLAFTTISVIPTCDCYEEHVEDEECTCECHSVSPANERHWIEG